MAHKQEWFTLTELTLAADQLWEGRSVDRVMSTLRNWQLAPAYLDRVAQTIHAALVRAAPHRCVLSIHVFIPRTDARLGPGAIIALSGREFFLIDRTMSDAGEGERHLIDVFIYAENQQPA